MPEDGGGGGGGRRIGEGKGRAGVKMKFQTYLILDPTLGFISVRPDL